ncbi:MAG: relaxase/mobilization nuclease domain-containing protein [Clostridia bacterium]|nr:relaxase/mobilization nuclease domain-containing protein [Clostridia bacterium]
MLTVIPLSNASSPRRIIKYVTGEGRSPIIRVRNLERSDSYESYIDQFRSTMDFYGKFSSSTDKRCYHYTIGASAEDGVSPEEIMDITEEFVDRVFPGYEVVMALHEKDTKGPHSHFVVNAVNIRTGVKMQMWRKDWMRAEIVLNDISREHGIEERDLDKRNGASRTRSEIYITRRGESSWVSNVRNAADEAIETSSCEPEFVFRMAEKGYPVEIKSDPAEYLYHNPENSFTVRGRKLGADYTRRSLMERFSSGADSVPEPVVPVPVRPGKDNQLVTIWGAAPGDEVSYGEFTEERFRLTEDWRRYATLFAYWGFDFWDLNEFCLLAERGDIIEWHFFEGPGVKNKKISAPKPECLADIRLSDGERAYALDEMIPARCSYAMSAAAAGEFVRNMDELTKLFGVRVPNHGDSGFDSLDSDVFIRCAKESDAAKRKNGIWFCDLWLDYAARCIESGRPIVDIDRVHSLAREGRLIVHASGTMSKSGSGNVTGTYCIEPDGEACDGGAPIMAETCVCLPEDVSVRHRDACRAVMEGKMGEFFDSLSEMRNVLRCTEKTKDIVMSGDEITAADENLSAKRTDEIIESVWLPFGDGEKHTEKEIISEWRRYAKCDGAAGYGYIHLDEYMKLAKKGGLVKIRAFYDGCGVEHDGRPVELVVPEERIGKSPQRVLNENERYDIAFKADLEYFNALFPDDNGQDEREISSCGSVTETHEQQNRGNDFTDAPESESNLMSDSKHQKGYEIGKRMAYVEEKESDYRHFWISYAEHVSALGYNRVPLEEYMSRAKRSELVKMKVCYDAENGQNFDEPKCLAVPVEVAGDSLITVRRLISPEEKSKVFCDIKREFDEAEKREVMERNGAQNTSRKSVKGGNYDGK